MEKIIEDAGERFCIKILYFLHNYLSKRGRGNERGGAGITRIIPIIFGGNRIGNQMEVNNEQS